MLHIGITVTKAHITESIVSEKLHLFPLCAHKIH